MGLKRKIPKDIQLLNVPGPSPRRQSVAEMRANLEAKGSAAIKELFEGNYEERRKFGVVDIFDTLGFAVSDWLNLQLACIKITELLHAALLLLQDTLKGYYM